jgi:hypothetical protein
LPCCVTASKMLRHDSARQLDLTQLTHLRDEIRSDRVFR